MLISGRHLGIPRARPTVPLTSRQDFFRLRVHICGKEDQPGLLIERDQDSPTGGEALWGPLLEEAEQVPKKPNTKLSYSG